MQQQPGNPPQTGVVPPQQGGYPPQQGGYPTQQGGYPPQQGGFPPQQGGFPPQQGGYPPQQGGYPPQQGGYPPQQFIPYQTPSGKTLTGFERLADKQGLYIKQKVDIAEIASGCERQNSYFIHDIDKSGEKAGVEILRAKEESGWCARQFLAGNCRPFRMQVQLRDTNLKAHNAPFLEIERPCTCTCYCFARPVITVSHVEDGKRTHLGKIENPFKLCNCDYKMSLYNATNTIIYRVVAKCCQTGVLYGAYPCQSCQTVDFQITAGGGSMVVGNLQKRTAGFFASLTSLSDNFALTFPSNSTVEDKALLLAATLFADYQWFEKQVGCTF